MGKLQEKLQGVRQFVADVAGEMKKTSWPGREELISSTVMVIVSVVMLSLCVGVFDRILRWILSMLVYRV
jgi:preprotein translocase subunit SecE